MVHAASRPDSRTQISGSRSGFDRRGLFAAEALREDCRRGRPHTIVLLEPAISNDASFIQYERSWIWEPEI